MSTVNPSDGTAPEILGPGSGQPPFRMPPAPQGEGAPDRRHILFGYIEEDIRQFPGNCAVVGGDVDGLSDINWFKGQDGGDAFLEGMRRAFDEILIGVTRGAALAADTGERRRRTDAPTDDEPKIPFRARFVHINGDEIGIAIVGINNPEDLEAYITRMVTRLRDEYNVPISMGGAIHQEGQTARELYATAFHKEQANKNKGRVASHSTLPPRVKAGLTTARRWGQANGVTLRTMASWATAAAEATEERDRLVAARRAARVLRKAKIIPVPSSSDPQ